MLEKIPKGRNLVPFLFSILENTIDRKRVYHSFWKVGGLEIHRSKPCVWTDLSAWNQICDSDPQAEISLYIIRGAIIRWRVLCKRNGIGVEMVDGITLSQPGVYEMRYISRRNHFIQKR